MIAALFIDARGPYANREDVDAWDIERDARLYDGPHPVVAHPPCQRWGRYWSGGPSAKERRELGDDDGCFLAALDAVREHGGVLEHPEASHAFKRFRLPLPPKAGGWVRNEQLIKALDVVDVVIADEDVRMSLAKFREQTEREWTCCVEQGHYGHTARKATWLFYVGEDPPKLKWGASAGVRLDEGFHSKAERDAARARGQKPVKRLSTKENLLTPPAFAELLLSLARHSQTDEVRHRLSSLRAQLAGMEGG